MQLEKMSAKNLKEWVNRLVYSLKSATNNKDRFIYQKWLDEAKAEQARRLEARLVYIRRYNERENKTRGIY